mgnify:CR=1 FL=1
MNVTLLGALRQPDTYQRRSDFYRAWEVSLRATRNVAESLQVMEPPPDAGLEEARTYLVEGMAKGRPVGVVAKLRPDLFPVLDQLLIVAGENFGTLHDSLRLLSEYYLREHARFTRIRGWAGVPIVLGVAASFAAPLASSASRVCSANVRAFCTVTASGLYSTQLRPAWAGLFNPAAAVATTQTASSVFRERGMRMSALPSGCSSIDESANGRFHSE